MWLYFSKLFTGRGGCRGRGLEFGSWTATADPALEEGWILVRISLDEKGQLDMPQDSLWSWPGSSTIPLRQYIPLEWIFSLKVIPMGIWAGTICYSYFGQTRRDNEIYFVACVGGVARKEATVSFCCPPDCRGAPWSGSQDLRANLPLRSLVPGTVPSLRPYTNLMKFQYFIIVSIFSWNKQMRS